MALQRREFQLLAAAAAFLLQGCEIMENIQAATGVGQSNAGQSSAGQRNASAGETKSAVPAVPLAAGMWGGDLRLLVDVSPGSDASSPKQRLVLDTGSSTLAFCSKALTTQPQYQQTSYISCNIYNPGGTATGYWGPFVKGPVLLGGFQLDADYSIMAQELNMPCTQGLQGIFGIAFRQLDSAYHAEQSPDWPTAESRSGSPGTSLSCPKQPAGVEPSPLISNLRSMGGEQIGIYWSGQQGDEAGSLYLGEAATLNQHYDASSALGPAQLGELGWYDIQVQSITVGSQSFTDLVCDPSRGKTCIMDTGTPAIVVPEEVFNYAQISGGSLTFQLAGAGGAPTLLQFDLQALRQANALMKANSDDGMILGLPLWMFYYTVFDIGQKTAYFVPTSNSAMPAPVPAEEPQPGSGGDSPWNPQPAGDSPWNPQPAGDSPWNPQPAGDSPWNPQPAGDSPWNPQPAGDSPWNPQPAGDSPWNPFPLPGGVWLEDNATDPENTTEPVEEDGRKLSSAIHV